MIAPRIEPLGESALTVILGDRIEAGLHRQVRALGEAIRHAGLAPIVAIVPAYAAVTVYYDSQRTTFGALAAQVGAIAAGVPAGAIHDPGREVLVRVRYDGPDLAAVAHRTGLSPAEVITRHTAPTYRVYLLGFVPGFAYLGDLDPRLVLPRRTEPRARVAAGAVAIGGAQTAVYPLATPGGWHLLGHTDLPMFEPGRQPSSLLQVGDRVRFEPC